MNKFYGYNKCSTCQKAKKYLDSLNIKYEDIDIISNPPSKELLNKILDSKTYDLKSLFNTSGQLYREMNIKDKINVLSQDQLLDLLSNNGKLVKRPLIVINDKYVLGFKEDKIKELSI